MMFRRFRTQYERHFVGVFTGGFVPPFFVLKMVDFRKGVTRGVTRGVTERGYTFLRKGLQKWALRVHTGEGYKYHIFNFNPNFYADTPTIKTTSFAALPPQEACKTRNSDSFCGMMEGDTKGRGTV